MRGLQGGGRIQARSAASTGFGERLNLMPVPLSNSRDVADAIRAYLAATPATADEAMIALDRLTGPAPLRNVDTWERTIREELYRAESGQSANAWTFWKRPVRFATWLDLCNADGWKREAILRTANGPRRTECSSRLRFADSTTGSLKCEQLPARTFSGSRVGQVRNTLQLPCGRCSRIAAPGDAWTSVSNRCSPS
jgi:hypothetical protein